MKADRVAQGANRTGLRNLIRKRQERVPIWIPRKGREPIIRRS
jgi:hypothetical protein